MKNNSRLLQSTVTLCNSTDAQYKGTVTYLMFPPCIDRH